MHSMRRTVLASAMAALAGGFATPVRAAETVNISATVLMAAPCVTVASTQLDFGVQGFSTPSQDTTATAPLSFSSCSDAAEFIFVHGTDAIDAGGGAATWSLTGSQITCPDRPLNKYRVTLRSTGGFGSFDLMSASWLLGGFSPGAQSQLDEVQLVTPCVGSDGSGASMSFQIVFTASF